MYGSYWVALQASKCSGASPELFEKLFPVSSGSKKQDCQKWLPDGQSKPSCAFLRFPTASFGVPSRKCNGERRSKNLARRVEELKLVYS